MKKNTWGTWVAQSVKHPTLTQVMISWLVSSSPVSSSVLTAQSLEPASDSVSPPLSLPLPCSLSVCLSVSTPPTQKQINIEKEYKKKGI